MVLEETNVSTNPMDKYEEAVDLQNNCRSFYLNRVKATEDFKTRMETSPNTENRKRNSLSAAMDKLRSEMSSLVDQDLSLMKQLLTLNESIEELKNRRLYGVSKEPLEDSHCNISSSNCLSKHMSLMSLSSDCSSSVGSEDESYKRLSLVESEDSGYGE